MASEALRPAPGPAPAIGRGPYPVVSFSYIPDPLNIRPVRYNQDMRIACIHLPQFPLQVAVRDAPSLRGRPVAIVGGASTGIRALGAPVVIACSRAARALGIRLGMTAPKARALS